MNIKAVDNMVLVWLLKTPTPDTKEMHNRCRYLIDIAQNDKTMIIVPAPVLSEFLSGIPQADHPRFLSEVAKYFTVAPFDAKASAIASDIWIKHRGLPKDQQIARTILKVDVLNVACACAFGAQVFVSNDKGCRTIAKYVMQAEDLPQFHPNMFVNSGLPMDDPNIKALPAKTSKPRRAKTGMTGPRERPALPPGRSA